MVPAWESAPVGSTCWFTSSDGTSPPATTSSSMMSPGFVATYKHVARTSSVRPPPSPAAAKAYRHLANRRGSEDTKEGPWITHVLTAKTDAFAGRGCIRESPASFWTTGTTAVRLSSACTTSRHARCRCRSSRTAFLDGSTGPLAESGPSRAMRVSRSATRGTAGPRGRPSRRGHRVVEGAPHVVERRVVRGAARCTGGAAGTVRAHPYLAPAPGPALRCAGGRPL